MADEVDRANDEAGNYLTELLRKRRPAGPVPTGRCHYCDDIVSDTQRWCSIECREGWEKETERKTRT